MHLFKFQTYANQLKKKYTIYFSFFMKNSQHQWICLSKTNVFLFGTALLYEIIKLVAKNQNVSNSIPLCEKYKSSALPYFSFIPPEQYSINTVRSPSKKKKRTWNPNKQKTIRIHLSLSPRKPNNSENISRLSSKSSSCSISDAQPASHRGVGRERESSYLAAKWSGARAHCTSIERARHIDHAGQRPARMLFLSVRCSNTQHSFSPLPCGVIFTTRQRYYILCVCVTY